MSVDVQDKSHSPKDVLSRILLSQIRPSKRNTRRIIREEMVEARRASMADGGQVNPIIIRPLTDQEKAAAGSSLEPAQPNLGPQLVASAQLEPDKNILYEIVDGEIRYWAAKKNGDKEIDAIIKNLTPEEAVKNSVKGNRGFKTNWFEDSLVMEELSKKPFEMEQQAIAGLFEVDGAVVSRALKLLKVLNPASRAFLFDSVKRNEGVWQFRERPTSLLGEVKDEAKVESTLKVIQTLELETPQIKDLVAHIQGGGDPAQFEPAKKAPKPRKAVESLQPTFAEAMVGTSSDGSPAETPKKAGSPQSTVDSKQNNQKTQQPSGAGSTTEPALPKPRPGLDGQPKGKDAIDGLKKAGKEAKEELGAKVAQAKAKYADAHKESAQPNLAAPLDGSQQVPPGGKPSRWESLKLIGHFLWIGTKLAFKCLKHLAKWVVKRVHHDCGYLAKQLVPHHGKSGLGGNLSRLVVQRVVYLVLTLAAYGLPLGLIASLFGGWHWIYSTGMALVHLVFIQWPLGLAVLVLQSPWAALGLWVLLLVWIKKAFQPKFLEMVVIAVLLVVVWWFRGWWMGELHISLPSVPRSQTEEQGLSAPIPEKGIGASSTTPKASLLTTTRPKSSKVYLPTANRELPTSSYLPAHAWTESDEDRAYLDSELLALPQPCRILDFPVTVDAAMGEGMATGRLQDLADPDKYTLMSWPRQETDPVGHRGRHGAHPELAGGRLGKPGGQFPGCGLWPGQNRVLLGRRQGHPLQQNRNGGGPSPSGLPMRRGGLQPEKALHGAMRQRGKLRAPGFGHGILHPVPRGRAADTIGGLPYLNQGVRLDGDGKAVMMWDNSPVEKAGVLFGDRLWSVDTNTYGRQSRETLEAALQALASGKHNLFVVTPKDWDNARRSEDFHSDTTPIPERRLYSLTVP